MNRIKDYSDLEDRIVKWISDYCLLITDRGFHL